MNNYKRYTTIFFIALTSCVLNSPAFAQTADVQYLSEAHPAGWAATNVGQKPDSVSVWIQDGTSVALDEDASINSMLIDKSARLNSAGYTLMPVAPTSFILNYGTIGSDQTGNRLNLYITRNVKNFTLMGSGKADIGELRPLYGNSSLQVNIQQDVNLSLFTAIPVKERTSYDDIIFNIAEDKTVKLKNAAALFHNALPDKEPAGKYTYNINGTMDASAASATQNITPLSAQASVVTMNISGVLKLSDNVNIASPEGSKGRLVLNVLNGGVADATLTRNFVYGSNYFTTHGTGVLKRYVNATTAFPVGAPGSTSFSPVVIHGGSVGIKVSASVKNQFDVSPPNSTKVVNKQWTIIPESNSGNQYTVQPLWGPNDVASGFNYNAPMAIYGREAGSSAWVASAATKISSPGPAMQGASAPFIARSGVIIVQNTSPDAGAATVSLYPNPTSDVVNVDFPETSQESTIQITTYQGRNMAAASVKKGVTNWKYNISSWPAGFYFLKMKDGDRESAIKFVKK